MIFLKRQNFLSSLLALGLSLMLLLRSAELGDGIRKGLEICSFSVIPALFPFMVLSVFICKSSLADFFAKAFLPVTKLLRLPKDSAGAIFASLIGGYPTGAKCINDLVISGKIDRKSAERMLCFCVNAGPPFLISAVGTGIFGSAKTGFLLFFAQLFSSAAIAFFSRFFAEKSEFPEYSAFLEKKSKASCLTESVISAAESCFNMCAFIVLSFGLLELFENGALFSAIKNPIAKALFSGAIEVTAGCFSAGEAEGFSAIIAAGAVASFSGISVMLRVAAATEKSGISLLPFFVSRFFHAGLTSGFVFAFLRLFGEAAEVFSVKGGSYEAVLSASVPAAVSLLCMASLFLLSLVPPKSEKKPLLKRLKEKFAKKEIPLR